MCTFTSNIEVNIAGVTSGSNSKLPADDAQVNMIGMEHYKKRLIHQHEKPGALTSPYTTTEEDDDSLESPLSPASSNVSREGGQQDRRKDEVVQKVVRKRAVCRSQFRHQSMELFKLGNSEYRRSCVGNFLVRLKDFLSCLNFFSFRVHFVVLYLGLRRALLFHRVRKSDFGFFCIYSFTFFVLHNTFCCA